ncbi:glycine zipper 2TM domain-containing protein [Chitinibacteraceae bacterium HSL-7]
MKTRYWIALLLGMVVAAPLLADDWDDDDHHHRRNYGRIYSVMPVYDMVRVPQEKCRTEWINETREVRRGRDYTGVVVGGIAGGAIGAQIGEGRTQDVATVAGAVTGAVIGDKVMDRHTRTRTEVVPREVTTCHTVRHSEQRLRGYQVAYRFRGREFSTFTKHHPGRPGGRFIVPGRYRDDD